MNQWKHKILAHGTLIITNWVYLTYLIGASCRGSLLLSAWQDAIFSVAVCMLRGVVVAVTVYIYFLLWQYPLYFEVAADTFGCGSIYFLLWQHLLFVVAADAFGRGSIHFLLWQYPLFVVETDTFGSGSIHFLLWQYPLFVVAAHTFGRGSVHFFCGSSSVLDQVVRGRCHFWGYIQAISPDNFSTEDHARANS